MTTMEEGQILKNIKNLAPKHCDNCGSMYMPNNFKVLRVIENSALIHLSCSDCGNTYVINAYASNMGIGSQRMPLILDLEDVNEVERFANLPPISKDDAIDLFNFLGENMSIKDLFNNTKVTSKKELRNLSDSNPS